MFHLLTVVLNNWIMAPQIRKKLRQFELLQSRDSSSRKFLHMIPKRAKNQIVGCQRLGVGVWGGGGGGHTELPPLWFN